MKIKFFIEVMPGDVWVNDQGYKLKVLDVSHAEMGPETAELWLEWENGAKGAWTGQKFYEARYRLYERGTPAR